MVGAFLQFLKKTYDNSVIRAVPTVSKEVNQLGIWVKRVQEKETASQRLEVGVSFVYLR